MILQSNYDKDFGKKPAAKYSIEIKDNSIKIFIKSILHLSFKRDNLLGIQSWIKGIKKPVYCIEITFINGTIVLSEYTLKNDWIQILKLFENEKIY